MATGGALADDSLYGCLLNAVKQGVSIKQAVDDCATKLVQDAERGFGGTGIPGPPSDRDGGVFDPASITGACAGGDATVSQTSGWSTIPYHGGYSWGLKGEHRDSNGLLWNYKGLSEENSLALKKERMEWAEFLMKESDAAFDASKEAQKKYDEAVKGGDKNAISAAEAELNAAKRESEKKSKEYIEAEKTADGDPNASPPSTSRPSQADSRCAEALQAARELLRECHRVAWNSYACQALQASMTGCPDPALVLVGPEGYTCAAIIDSEELRLRYIAHCRELVRPTGPDVDPCGPPNIDDNGRFLRSSDPSNPDVCSDPRAYLTPEMCAGILTLPDFGFRNMRDLLVIALEKLGGPTVVLPLGDGAPPGNPTNPADPPPPYPY